MIDFDQIAVKITVSKISIQNKLGLIAKNNLNNVGHNPRYQMVSLVQNELRFLWPSKIHEILLASWGDSIYIWFSNV